MARLLSFAIFLFVGNFINAYGEAENEAFETRQLLPSSCLVPCFQRCSVYYGNPAFGGAPSKGGNTGINAGKVSGQVSNDGTQVVGNDAKFSGGINNGKRDTIETRQASNLFTCYTRCSVLFGGGFAGVVGGGSSAGSSNVGINAQNVEQGGSISNDGVQVVGDGANFGGGINNGNRNSTPRPSQAPTQETYEASTETYETSASIAK